MATQRVALGQLWVIEVGAPVADHAYLLHHATGAEVRGNGERDHLVEPELLEGVTSRAASVASPCPQYARASRQPISTHGVKAAVNSGTVSPR